jgi:pantoate--beta-alanine ligase
MRWQSKTEHFPEKNMRFKQEEGMQVIRTLSELRQKVRSVRASGQMIAFVPTMGFLHDGHLSLVQKANEVADFVVVSIFVNPLQFGCHEDLDSYPQNFDSDRQKLADMNVDVVFAPTVSEMYPDGLGEQTIVKVPEALSQIHCGEFRPGHFDGVATVVTKLFGMVQPDIAIFGEKDYQQLVVIRRIVRDLSLPVEIIGMPTCREADGLAMSSRNSYLSPEERAKAPRLYQVLNQSKETIRAGERNYLKVAETAEKILQEGGFEPQYFRICSQLDLEPADESDETLVILVAAMMGTTRLIDNIAFDLAISETPSDLV